MTIAETLLGALGLRPEKPFCRQQFPGMWTAFADHLVETGFTGHACASAEQAGVHEPTTTVLPAASRLIAIGDLHGDLGKARRVFRAAGLTNEEDRWVGGDTVCVQVGDILDRGDAELRILYFLESLQAQAQAAGGALHVLNGNHETMNVMGNHRYATEGATTEIERWNQWQQLSTRLKAACGCGDSPTSSNTSSSSTSYSPLSFFRRAAAASQPPPAMAAAEAQGMYGAKHFVRTFALQPGSTIAKRFFATHPTVLQVGSTVFVHGGILEQHVEYGLDKINQETSAWLRGEQSDDTTPTGTPQAPTAPPPASSFPGSAASVHRPLVAPRFLRGADAVVWARNYSSEDGTRCECDTLQKVLQGMPGASRMVMGHTIQRDGVNAACQGRALRVDVGMSRGCGNNDVEALEILQDGIQVRRLREGLAPEDVVRPVAPPMASQPHLKPEAPARSWWPFLTPPAPPPAEPQPVASPA